MRWKKQITNVNDRNQEQFVRRLINAQSHFATQGMDERIESRDKLIQLKTHAKKF